MAKQGLKKRAEENTKRLRLLTLAVAAANVRPSCCYCWQSSVAATS